MLCSWRYTISQSHHLRHILNSIVESEAIYLECLSVSLQYMKAMKVKFMKRRCFWWWWWWWSWWWSEDDGDGTITMITFWLPAETVSKDGHKRKIAHRDGGKRKKGKFQRNQKGFWFLQVALIRWLLSLRFITSQPPVLLSLP